MSEPIVYGLIPARGGSKGLPGKNIRLLAGQPLISHIIRAALAAETLDKVFVSTDSEEIAAIARECGAEVIVHSAELSADTAPSFGVVANAARIFSAQEHPPEIIVMMRPTSPLCESQDIDQAVRMLAEHPEADSVVSVMKADSHPYRAYAIDSKGELAHFDERSPERDFPLQRQAFGDVYVRNGAIYAARAAVIESGSLWGRHSLAYIMPKERSVNINDEIDFLFAEALMERRAT